VVPVPAPVLVLVLVLDGWGQSGSYRLPFLRLARPILHPHGLVRPPFALGDFFLNLDLLHPPLGSLFAAKPTFVAALALRFVLGTTFSPLKTMLTYVAVCMLCAFLAGERETKLQRVEVRGVSAQ
jgi:hypothetical protein